MKRRQFITTIPALMFAGCTEELENEENGRLDLTIRNEHSEPIAVDVTIVDAEGTTRVDLSDRIEGGTVQSFEFVVGTGGRHEVIVSGDEWRSQQAWDVDTCALYEGVVTVAPDRIDTRGECAGQR